MSQIRHDRLSENCKMTKHFQCTAKTLLPLWIPTCTTKVLPTIAWLFNCYGYYTNYHEYKPVRQQHCIPVPTCYRYYHNEYQPAQQQHCLLWLDCPLVVSSHGNLGNSMTVFSYEYPAMKNGQFEISHTHITL